LVSPRYLFERGGTDWGGRGRTFDEEGKMKKRQMSGNDLIISETERWFVQGVDIDTYEVSDVHG
jgi:nuclear transport factor 2 (NTF2) superfamily protein